MPAFTIRYDAELESKFDALKLLFNQSTKNKVLIELIKEYPALVKRHENLATQHDALLAKHWELLNALQQRDEIDKKIEGLTQTA